VAASAAITAAMAIVATAMDTTTTTTASPIDRLCAPLRLGSVSRDTFSRARTGGRCD
jgi:hypothetical protein